MLLYSLCRGNTTTKSFHPLSALAKTEQVCQHARVMNVLLSLVSLMFAAASVALLLPWVARFLTGLDQKSVDEKCGESSLADGLQPADGRAVISGGFDGIIYGIVWLMFQPVLAFLLLLAVSSRTLGARALWFWLVLMIPPCLGAMYRWRKLNRAVSHSGDLG